jgi:Mn2+/Fe2+ NRAMP family transporter
MNQPPKSRFWTSFGPGLLWAAAAIGVSHLVQSTRAGAVAGFALAGVILLALVLKYPFFEFGPRYAAATGESLVEGYARIGRWAVWLYLLITVTTGLIVQAAVVAFTAFLFSYVFGLTWSLPVVGALVVGGCAALLFVGRYKLLDGTIKVVLVLLAVSTLIAAVVTIPRADLGTFRLWPGNVVGTLVPFGFLLALMGWMPSAIDISIWSSLWTLAKNEVTGTRVSVADARLDFNIGYFGTGFFAFAFLILGAGVMYGSGQAFSPQGMAFATQLVDLYSTTLGEWMRPVVMVAVVTTMFSTSLTVIDGFPRGIERSVQRLLVPVDQPVQAGARIYWLSIFGLWIGTVGVLALFVSSLTAMIDVATIVSFLTAPALGYLNLRAVQSDAVPVEHRPGKGMVWLSWIGLVLLGGTAIVYLTSILT